MSKRKTVYSFILILTIICSICLGTGNSVVNAATINITSYGATPNDSTDDLAAINNAINAAKAGDTVNIPNGTFNISASIIPKSGVKIMGESKDGSIVKFIGTQDAHMIDIGGKSIIEISNFTITANNNSKALNGILVQNSNNIDIHDLVIKDFVNYNGFGPHGIYFTGDSNDQYGVTNSKISDCTIVNIGVSSTWGVGIRISRGSSVNQITGNYISNTGRGGILCNNNANTLTIKNNRVEGSGKTAQGLGIELWGGCNNSIVEDNTIDHWLSLDSVSNVAVRRNIISDKSGTYKFGGLEYVDSLNCVVTDNLVDDGQNIGITISGPQAKNYAYFAYNTIKKCNQFGAQIQGEAGYAKHLYFYKNNFITSTINNNPIWPGIEGVGVHFNGNSEYITLDSCTIIDNQRHGIRVSGSNVNRLSFINNRIINNAGYGFYPYSGYSALEFSNNNVSGNGNNNAPAPANFNNQKPVAAFSSVSSANVGQSITFTNNSYDPDGSISRVLWDFNDGLPTTSTSPSYTYTKAGYYRVSLVVWDNHGRASRTEKLINVGNATPQGSAFSIIEAESCNSSNGVIVSSTGIGGCDNNDWVCYENINFGNTGANNFIARVAVDPAYAGKNIEIRLDKYNGPLIGTLTVANTGGWSNYTDQSVTVSGADGIHDIYLVFKGGSGICNMDWFKFTY